MAVKIMVTGASGFIGGAFIRRFANTDGVSLCGVGRREHVELPASVEYYALELDQLHTLDVVPDVVIHAAGRTSPRGSEHDYYRDNVETTRHVIDFCRHRGFPRLIFISSAAVYYRFAHQPDCVNVMLSAPNLAANMGAQNVRQSALLRRIRVRKPFFALVPYLVKAIACSYRLCWLRLKRKAALYP